MNIELITLTVGEYGAIYKIDVDGEDITKKVDHTVFWDHAKENNYYYNQVSEDTFVRYYPKPEEVKRDQKAFYEEYFETDLKPALEKEVI